MKRLAGLAILLAGIFVASVPVALCLRFVETMRRFGGVPWTWALLSLNAGIIAVLTLTFLFGVFLVAVAVSRFLRARR